jgi:hypothetical protein
MIAAIIAFVLLMWIDPLGIGNSKSTNRRAPAVKRSGRKSSGGHDNGGAVQTAKKTGNVLAPVLIVGILIVIIVWASHPELLPASMR